MCEPVSQLWTTWIILGTSSITSQLNVNTHLYHHLYSISSSLHHHLYHHLSCHHRHNTTTGIYQCCVNGRVYQLMVKLLANHIFHHTIQLLYHWNKWGRSCDIELELTKKICCEKNCHKRGRRMYVSSPKLFDTLYSNFSVVSELGHFKGRWSLKTLTS